ncbi:hypothetical protein D1872_354520 [compost metagenome]
MAGFTQKISVDRLAVPLNIPWRKGKDIRQFASLSQQLLDEPGPGTERVGGG